jgi:hypothetical protein
VNSGTAGAGDTGAGRGAGFGPGVGREPPGTAGAAGAAGFSAAAGFGAGGRGAAGRATCAGEGAPGLAGAALRAEADLPPPLPCWRASVSLRTTGASIVDDADRTNSPSSWSLAMTTLLSTPNSLASSYTRTLATSLLLGPGCVRTVATSWAYSSRAHRVLIAISTYFQLAEYQAARGSVRRVEQPPHRRGRLTVLPARLPPFGNLLPARRGGATPLCRAVPGRAAPVETPGGGPPGRDRQGRGVHTHPGRAAYREDRGHSRPRPPRCAAVRSWPLAPGTPHRCVQGRRGHASGQTPLSLPPCGRLTPLGQESNSCCA